MNDGNHKTRFYLIISICSTSRIRHENNRLSDSEKTYFNLHSSIKIDLNKNVIFSYLYNRESLQLHKNFSEIGKYNITI